MSMKKPAALMAGVGTCALAVASCSSPAPAPQSDPVVDSSPSAVQSGAQSGAQSGPGSAAPTLPVGDVDNALTSRDGQSGPGAQSGPADSSGDVEATGPAVFVVVLEEGADRAATLASINKAVAAAFPGESVEVEREYVNALQGWSLRAPAGALEAIRGANGVESAYLDGEMRVQ
mgnify:FL=1